MWLCISWIFYGNENLKIKILACPDCRKKFEKLQALNTHIGKSGHNDGKKITKWYVFKICGLFRDTIFEHEGLQAPKLTI